MKAHVPMSWRNLPKKERDSIVEYCRQQALQAAIEQSNKDARIMLDLYIKMVCVVLHDAFGFGEKRLNMFLANHRRLFHRQMKMVKDGSQIEYLNRRMSDIFRKDGFPQGFFDEMLGEVEG